MKYNMQSSRAIYAPGIVEFAIAGARDVTKSQKFADMIEQCWKVPADVALGVVTGKIPYVVDGETVVVTVHEAA